MRPIAPLFAVVVLASACATPVAQPAADLAPAANARGTPAKFSIERESEGVRRIQEDIAYLASAELAGRGTGEAGATLAAQFVAKRFAAMGLVPLGDVADGRRSFLQRFRAQTGVDIEAPSLMWDPPGPALITLISEEISTADGSSNGSASGEPVFVGFGVAAAALGWDDYARLDVAGKVVVVLMGAPALAASDSWRAAEIDFASPQYKIRMAAERKAVGVVLVKPEGEMSSLPTRPAGGGIPAIELPRELATGVFPKAGFEDGSPWRVARAGSHKALGAEGKMTFTTRVQLVEVPTWNVIGMLPARSDSPVAAEYVVVGAHYDHVGHGETATETAQGRIHPGADDNASGTALLLELARRFSRLPRRPDRGIVFSAFGAEEVGLLGSRHFVNHPPVPLSSMVAMINADMVGRLRRDKLILDGFETSKSWGPLALGASRGLGLQIKWGGERIPASDHRAFEDARVPFLYFFTGHHEDYHHPSDTHDKVNPEGVERIATMAGRVVLSVAGSKERPVFAERSPLLRLEGNQQADLGARPDPGFGGRGVRIVDAPAESPAARAGAMAGDVVMQVGARSIQNMSDYAVALKGLEVGRPIEVIVARNGKRIALEMVPELED